MRAMAAPLLQLKDIALTFGGTPLLTSAELSVATGERVCLVGRNGSGKSTLLRIAAGAVDPDKGSVFAQPGASLRYLAQEPDFGDAPSVLAYVEAGLGPNDGDYQARQMLDELGLHGDEDPSHLSGGEARRAALARVLAPNPDILLLDEPTNHLDILTIRWLEKFLAAYKGCAVIISHDQRFLDNVSSHILDVDYRTITMYTGSYSTFVVEKAAIRERKEATIARAEDEIARKRAWVERFGAKNTKATQAQSRLKQIERIEVEELVGSSRRSPVLRFEQERPSGKDVLAIQNLSKSYGDKRVLSDVNLVLRRGERIGIIGPNGLGKSTLLKILVRRLAADMGEARWGHEVRFGYFPQDHREVLDDDDATPLGLLDHACPGASPTFVRSHLGRTLLGRGCTEEGGSPIGRRGRATHLCAAHRAKAQRAGTRRAHQPP